jgi:lysophospholipase L1-like esterase
MCAFLRFRSAAGTAGPTLLIAAVFTLASCAAAAAAPSQLIRNLRAGQSQTIVTYGTSLTRPAEWPEQLAAWLDAEFPGQAQVINRGIASMSSPEALARLDTLVLSQNPDTVFLEFAVNDALADRNISLDESRDNLNTMIDRILAEGPMREIILMTMNPAWDSPLGSHATFRPNLAQYYQGYRDVAAERGLLLIDHYVHWVQLRDSDLAQFQQYIPDGVHPTAEALQQIVTPEIIRSLTIPEPATLLLACGAAFGVIMNRPRRSPARSTLGKRNSQHGGYKQNA